MIQDAYQELSVGIIEFALDDYTSTIKSLGNYYKKLNYYLNSKEKARTRHQRIGDICYAINQRILNLHEIDRFLHGEWAKSLTQLDTEFLFEETKRKLIEKGYKVELMSMIVTTDDKGITVYAKERESANGKFITYSLPVSSKDTSGNWVKSYMACRFKKGVSLANKTKIKINNAFFTTSKSGDKVYTNLMITDFDVLEEGETAGNEADNFVPIPEPQDDPFL